MSADGLIDEFLLSEYEESPTLATSLGLDGYDHLLPDLSERGFARRIEKNTGWLERFESLPDEQLDRDEQIDRDLVVSSLRGRLIMTPWEDWRRNPGAYLGPGLNGVFTLFLHRLHDEDELARSAAARLRTVPDLLQWGKENLRPDMASPVIVERARGQCRAAIAYARTLVPDEAERPANRDTLADAGEVAAAAYEDFGAFLDGFAAAGPYAIGEQRYSALLLEKEQLGYGARDMLDRGHGVFDRLDGELRKLAQELKGTDDWVAVVSELSKNHPPTPDAMRGAYEEWTQRARQFLKDQALVTLPDGEECRVVPSPPFQRPVLAVASYNPPPAFRASLRGHFFVPYPPDGTPPDEVQKRLESNSNLDIPTTSVHEAYPGHHWHFTVLHANPRPIRKVLGSSYFTEGWALYTELMMREQGFYDDPVHELGMLAARIFRAARIIVDTSLHMSEMSFDEAVDFMQGKTGMTEPTAEAEVGRYCSWPTQAPSYLTGSLEIERMRERYLGSKDDLRSFHDSLAYSGMLPIGLAERALFDN